MLVFFFECSFFRSTHAQNSEKCLQLLLFPRAYARTYARTYARFFLPFVLGTWSFSSIMLD